MRTVFADIFYWIAVLNPRDEAHEIAVDVSKSLGGPRIVTTDEVLTEFLNYFGSRGHFFRIAVTQLVERMAMDGSIQILPQRHESFLAGYRLYQARPDKGATALPTASQWR